MSHSRVQTSEDEARGVADSHRWWALLVIGLAQLMVVLDATIVNVALPSAQRALGMSDNNRQWVITAYTLAFGGLLLLGGRVADLVGRKRTFIIGLIGFAVASGVGGAAGSSGMLFAARAAQGAFAALLAPSALSLLSTTFTDPKERSKAFGVYGAIAGAGAAIGLLLGGVLTEYLDWRWCLYVNVLFAGLTLLGALTLLHDRPGHQEARLDLPGAVLGCGGLIALVYGVSEAEPRGWDDAVVLGLLCGSALLLALFVLWQRRARTPLLPLHIVKDRNRAGSFLTMGLATLGMFGVFLFLTYYMQGILGYSPLRTGLAYLPISGAIILGSTQVSARLLPHVPPRLLMAPGMLLAAAGMAVLTQLETDSSYVSHLLPAELLFGFGLGCAFMPVISTATQGVAAHDSGVTSATVNTAQQVGGSIGTALLNTVATSITNTYVHDHLRDPKMRRAVVRDGVVHGFTAATWVAMAVMLLGAVLAAVLVTTKPIKPETADAGAPAPGAGSGG